MGAVLQMVDQNHRMAEEGHHRLRTDWRALERRVESLEAARVAADVRFTKIESTPGDVTKLQFPARFVAALCVICVGYGAGNYAISARLEANMMKAIEQQQAAFKELKNRVELSQIEMNTFKENLLRDLAGVRRQP